MYDDMQDVSNSHTLLVSKLIIPRKINVKLNIHLCKQRVFEYIE